MASSPHPGESVIDVALAEYAALRTEITNRIAAQDTMINVQLTATAAIVGFALSGRADPLILLVVPALSAAMRLLYYNHNLHIRIASAYLDEQLRPMVIERLGEPRLLGWQQRYAVRERMPRWRRLPHRAALAMLFPVPAVVALVLVVPHLNSAWTWLAWSAGWCLLLTQFVLTSPRVTPV